MGNNVGGNGNPQITVKLFNGKTINLNKLDKLVGKSVAGSIFAWADGKNGGLVNQRLDKEEIEFIKQKFLQAHATDNEVSQEELNEIFSSDEADEYGNKKEFNVNNLTRTLNAIKDDDDDVPEAQSGKADKGTPPPQQKDEVTTTYTIQPGDTPEKLAKRFGLSQEGLAALRAQTDKHGWFKVHQKVTLKGDHAAAIDEMRNSGEYSEDYDVLMARWANTESGKKQIAAAQNKTPDSVTNFIESIKKGQGTAELTKNADGTYSVLVKGTTFQKNNKLTQTITKFDKNGVKISQMQYMQNGNIKTLTFSPDGKVKSSKLDDADKTPQANRLDIGKTRAAAKKGADAIKGELQAFWTTNSTARNLLKTHMTNRQAAYVIEQYPDLVKDIDNVAGMDKNDVITYVVKPLNSRLRELGYNMHCIPADLSKCSIDDIKKKCAAAAKLIRQADAENGYVFKPNSGSEGKVHEPRRPSQASHYAAPGRKTAPKAPTKKSNTQSASKPATATNTTAPKGLTPDQKTRRNQMLSPNEWSLPQKMQDLIIDMRIRGMECTVSQKRDGSYEVGYKQSNTSNGGMEFTLPTVTDKEVLDKIAPGIMSLGANNFSNPDGTYDFMPDQMKEKTLVFDKNGNLVQLIKKDPYKSSVTNYVNNKVDRTDVNYNGRVAYGAVDSQRQVSSTDKVPVKIKINRSNNLGDDGNKFADSLENNKAALMAKLGLTNEQYDRLANIAMGIAEQETHFGTINYEDTSGESHVQGRLLKKKAYAALGGNLNSKGITQLRWGINFGGDGEPNKTLRKQLEAFGIKSENDYAEDPAKTAIATMIVLNNRRISAEGATWQRRLSENNAKITNPEDRITTEDIIALSWNGMGAIVPRFEDPKDIVTIRDKNSGKVDSKGNELKDGLSYARNVRAYRKHFYAVSEDANSRTRATSLSTEAQSNNGAIGTVIFMPTAYTTDVRSSKDDIANLENALNSNSSIPQNIKDRLLDAVRNDEIAFGGKGGLTEAEAKSITAKDAKLLLDKLDSLKKTISARGITSNSDIRALAQSTADDFRSSYLQSRQLVFNDSDIKKSAILPALGTGDVVNQRLKPRGGYKLVVNEGNVHNFRAGAGRSHITRDGGQYYGFGVEADKGVNPYDANGRYLSKQQRMIAEVASDVAAMMDCGGNCTTGVKVTFESAGVVKSRNDIGFAEADGSWNNCKTARDLARYFQKHPEKFEEVKYLSLGNGTSREINASDIKNLPAGYIVVFIPGPGYENQAGHAFITNGNGQGYADEVDNIRWDNFVSKGAGNGKGEHGTFKIFKLSDKFKLNEGGGVEST